MKIELIHPVFLENFFNLAESFLLLNKNPNRKFLKHFNIEFWDLVT